MDAVSDPEVETVVAMTSAQIGKTEVVNNVVGYHVEQDPCPILVLQPTLEMAQTWSKDRLAPMLRDTPCLHGLVRDARARDSGNTMLHKQFPGGHITMCGANSPAGLASRPIRVVLSDEVDRYPFSAGTEGDPVGLAEKRATTFFNRKKVRTSTPTLKGVSRIEAAYLASDRRRYHVPCPHCDHMQVLRWHNIRWDKDADGNHLPETAAYYCEECGGQITDADKARLLGRGEWRAEAPFAGTAGFHISALYSPWVTFAEIVREFSAAKHSPELLQVWTNTVLGEPWEEEGQQADDGALLSRREVYGPIVPEGAGLLTAGVDVQGDRLEVEVLAWGLASETWSMETRVIPGDPTKPEVWSDLNDYLLWPWQHECGQQIRVVCACVDSGYLTDEVYKFVRPRAARRVFAVKGIDGPGKPIAGRPSTANAGKVALYPVGVDTAKDALFARLRIGTHGPGFQHFTADHDEEYFQQLTAEKKVTRFVKGFPVPSWVKTRARNEALDIRVYAMAAYSILNPNMDAVMQRIRGGAQPARHAEPVQATNPFTRGRSLFRGR
jgi:phage terminase large subunit GpA-like protein